jgi:DNA/RNA endonuclease YhcR with UshA esterase domain
MRYEASFLFLSVALLLSPSSAYAHHSFAAEYDTDKPVQITGTVTKVEWTNPHAHFYIDVKDANGNVANWNLELASPNVLIRNGWKRNSIKEGDTVRVTGVAAKDSPHLGSASLITLPDGRKLTFTSVEEPTK